MKQGLTELVFILDRSGSMSGLESDTIVGFNSLIEKQKQEPGDCVVTTVLFDDKYELLHDFFPVIRESCLSQFVLNGRDVLLHTQNRAEFYLHYCEENRCIRHFAHLRLLCNYIK